LDPIVAVPFAASRFGYAVQSEQVARYFQGLFAAFDDLNLISKRFEKLANDTSLYRIIIDDQNPFMSPGQCVISYLSYGIQFTGYGKIKRKGRPFAGQTFDGDITIVIFHNAVNDT